MSQRGHVRREGRVWRLMLRQAPGPGERRRQVSVRLGTVAELPTRAAARRAADRWLDRNGHRPLHAGSVVTWSQWLDRFEDVHVALHAAGTRSSQRSIITQHLRPAFPVDRPVHSITPEDVQEFIHGQRRAGVAPSTIRTRFALLRRVLRQAATEGLAVTPPSAAGIKFPKDEQVHATVKARAFTAQEAHRILAAASDPWRCAFALALYCGLRASEVTGLTWECVNLTSGLLQVRAQAIDGTLRPLKSQSSRASLRAPAALLAILKTYHERWQGNPGGFLFADGEGRPFRADRLREALHELVDALGLPRRGLHAFRHRCALNMAEAGCNPEVIRRAMRHSSLRTTSIYLEAAPEDIAAALERAANACRPSA